MKADRVMYVISVILAREIAKILLISMHVLTNQSSRFILFRLGKYLEERSAGEVPEKP